MTDNDRITTLPSAQLLGDRCRLAVLYYSQGDIPRWDRPVVCVVATRHEERPRHRSYEIAIPGQAADESPDQFHNRAWETGCDAYESHYSGVEWEHWEAA
jgi:hypothetical protein